MTRTRALLLTVVTLALATMRAQPAIAAPGGGVTFDRSQVSVTIGDKFTLTSTTAGDLGPGPLIAHLNVVSLSSDVYVDPEDWSSNRTQSLPDTPGARLDWPVQAVNAGTFDIYLVVVPTGAGASAQELIVSAPVRVTVANRRTVNAAGSLPIVIAVPLVLAMFAAAARWRRRDPTTSPGRGSAGD
jgi:hypothetical protein